MTRFYVLIAALLLAGCTTTPPPTSDWLVGHWCPDDARSIYAGLEVGLRPVRFSSDGTYSTFENGGRWRLTGTRLETTTSGPVQYRRIDAVERIGRERMAWTMSHGEREIWHRCPETP